MGCGASSPVESIHKTPRPLVRFSEVVTLGEDGGDADDLRATLSDLRRAHPRRTRPSHDDRCNHCAFTEQLCASQRLHAQIDHAVSRALGRALHHASDRADLGSAHRADDTKSTGSSSNSSATHSDSSA